MELSDLNDDCLRHISQNLGIIDLYHLGITCQRFYHIVGSFRQKLSINASDIISILEHRPTSSLLDALELFFSTIGHHVTSLNIVAEGLTPYSTIIDAFLRIVQDYCMHSMRHLRLHHYNRLNFNHMRRLLINISSLQLNCCTDTGPTRFDERTNRLESLSLIACNISTENLNSLLQHSDALKRLRIIGTLQKASLRLSDSVERLAHLQCLSLGSTATSDLRFIATLPALSHLQLFGYTNEDSRHIVDGALAALLFASGTCGRLTDLDLIACMLPDRSYATIARLPHLKRFTMSKNFWLTDDHLKLMGTLCGGLTHFQCFDCLKVTDVGVAAFVQHNAQLCHIDVSWCFRITEASVASACAAALQRSKCNERPQIYGNSIVADANVLMTFVAGGRTQINRNAVAELLSSDDYSMVCIMMDPKMPISISSALHECQCLTGSHCVSVSDTLSNWPFSDGTTAII